MCTPGRDFSFNLALTLGYVLRATADWYDTYAQFYAFQTFFLIIAMNFAVELFVQYSALFIALKKCKYVCLSYGGKDKRYFFYLAGYIPASHIASSQEDLQSSDRLGQPSSSSRPPPPSPPLYGSWLSFFSFFKSANFFSARSPASCERRIGDKT